MRYSPAARIAYHRLSSALFALLARKYAAGQRRPPSSGMLYDFQAVAYFASYADAMLLDRECAGLVKEMPPDPGHLMRAKVFSLADGEAFVALLDALAAQAPDNVLRSAVDLYGVADAVG